VKVSEISSILDQAGLPRLSREQLHELAGTDAGKTFGQDLRAFATGDRLARDRLEVTVRVLDPALRATLKRLGLTLTVEQLVTTARSEQRRFFDAVDAIANRTARASSARGYLTRLGVVASLSIAAPAPVPADPPYYSFKIFGSGAALCIAEATTRADRKHTINIEGAVALAGGGARKAFDWAGKIVVQLTVQEAYQVLALLENKTRSLRFDGHGREHDKSLQAEFQDSHYFFRLTQRGRPAVTVPVRPVDGIPMVALLYKQLLANEPHLRIQDIQAMVERMASMASR
jgi:hypothetical protein